MAMRYCAKCYIGGEYIPGEIIEDDGTLDEKTIDWLLKTGAIEEIAPVGQTEERTAAEVNEPVNEEPDLATGEPDPVSEESEESEENDDMGYAPEIDVMAGIVQEDKKAAHRKKGGKA
jgi:hypothetical protein